MLLINTVVIFCALIKCMKYDCPTSWKLGLESPCLPFPSALFQGNRTIEIMVIKRPLTCDIKKIITLSKLYYFSSVRHFLPSHKDLQIVIYLWSPCTFARPHVIIITVFILPLVPLCAKPFIFKKSSWEYSRKTLPFSTSRARIS